MHKTSIVFVEGYEFALRPADRCPDCEPRRFSNDELTILSVLRAVKRDFALMERVRSILGRFMLSVGYLEDDAVLQQIAHSLRAGQLHICKVIEEPRVRIGTQPGAAPQPQAPLAQSSSSHSSQPEPATFPEDHSPASQAQALQNAAQSGVPFCEVCQKAGSAA
jgi:hypothetical protein